MASKLFSFLSGDPLARAQEALREGKKDRAAELFAKGKDYPQAIRLCAEIGDVEKAVEYSMLAAFGQVPEGYSGADASQVGELLAVRGFHNEAIALFEIAGRYRQAAESALRLQQFPRAARLFEKGKAWAEAAVYFERAKAYPDVLRNLDLESKRLRQDPRTRTDPAAQGRLSKIELKRAEILTHLGRGAEGAALLRDVQATPKTAQMLEAAGKPLEAFQAFLQMGDPAKAAQVVARTPSLDRRQVAQLYLRAGQPLEAASLYAALGLAKEAAEAYAAGADGVRAGSHWAAAREPERAARAYLRADRPRDAARCFTAAGKSQLAATSYVRLGDHASAAACYVRAGLLLDAGSAYLAAGDRAQAAKVLTQIQPGDRDFDEAALLLGPVLIEEGLFEDALGRLRRVAIDERPGAGASPRLLERLYWEARALEGLSRGPEAAGLYEKVVALKADHRDSTKRLRHVQVKMQAAQASPAAPPTLAPLSTGQEGAGGGPTFGVSQSTHVLGPAGARPSPTGAELAAGQRLAGRYDILAELGRGGMGRVYKAFDRDLGEAVAIKTLLRRTEDGTAEEERLLREVQICRRITHPNVVRVYDLGRFEGGIFITMELLEGQRLDQLVTGHPNLPLATVRRILSEVGAGLEEAHALGVVHRDLKPTNVILTATRLKILDFGIARMAGFESQLTQTGFAVGSPMYMSPEQLQGIALDGRSDLYSLGVMTYLLLTGREPFKASNMTSLALQHLQDPPPPVQKGRPDLPPEWTELVHRLLAKQPAQRYASARELLLAVERLRVEIEPVGA